MRIIAGRIADCRGERENIIVSIEQGKIASVESLGAHASNVADAEADTIDASGSLLVPGFIDIHIHGGAGRYVMEGSLEALDAIAAHLAHFGVIGFLSTTVTGPWDLTARALDAAAKRAHSAENGMFGAAVLGCHLEGPYINPVKKGAQPGPFILAPDADDLVRHVGDNLDTVKVVTLAPEVEGALDLIRFLVRQGIVVSVGHTNATYGEVGAAIDAGARHVTHCFNAMRALDSREPGVVGAALSRPELNAELIWDNIHVHPSNCRALVEAKGPEGVILISDGIPGAGMPDGYRFSLGDTTVTASGGAARLPDGTLAGSLLTLDRAFHNARGYTAAQRAAMTSRNAAVALGLGHRKGLIAPGYDADLVVIGPDGAVTRTIIAGRNVYCSAR